MMKTTRAQIAATSTVVSWYFKTHHGKAHDIGLPPTFMDSTIVGEFAVARDDYEAGDPGALFRLLVACSMFQRLRDQLVLKILQNMPTRYAKEITDAAKLRQQARESSCEYIKSTEALRERCDLTKDVNGGGCCSVAGPCHLKEHTVAMKRYGHFGKVPTSLALALSEAGVEDLRALYERTRASEERSERERAIELETTLCQAWRVNQKIASMFLSLVTNPDLGRSARAPWSSGIDWTYFVVIDSNVDLFLTSINYQGGSSYDDRRLFLLELAKHISLRQFERSVSDYNPRLVQQALFLFMSASNRKAAPIDCTNSARSLCGHCPPLLVKRCPVRQRLQAD